jgi:hypothetical protein
MGSEPRRSIDTPMAAIHTAKEGGANAAIPAGEKAPPATLAK